MLFDPTLAQYYILSGGQSSRFGSDKAIAEVDGTPLILHTARVLQNFSSDVTVVSNGQRNYAQFGLRTIHDRIPNQGPLGGIYRAFQDATRPWIFVSACDVTGLTAEDVMALRGARPPAGAFYNERWEPLFAAYHASMIDELIAGVETQSSVWKVLEGRAERFPLSDGWGRIERWDVSRQGAR